MKEAPWVTGAITAVYASSQVISAAQGRTTIGPPILILSNEFEQTSYTKCGHCQCWEILGQ